MNADATLAALRLSDSFLPVGTDSVSYGLEQFVATDRVEDADDLAALLETYLRRQLGVTDLVALRAAHQAAESAARSAAELSSGERSEPRDVDGDLSALTAADRRLTSVTLAAEFRESNERTGERLLDLQDSLAEDSFLGAYAEAVAADEAPGNYPVALGAVAASEGIPAEEACLLACHGFCTGLLGAAQRLLRLGHSDCQRILDDLRPAMEAAVADSADRTIDEMAPFAPLIDVLAAEHERADRRLFLS